MCECVLFRVYRMDNPILTLSNRDELLYSTEKWNNLRSIRTHSLRKSHTCYCVMCLYISWYEYMLEGAFFFGNLYTHRFYSLKFIQTEFEIWWIFKSQCLWMVFAFFVDKWTMCLCILYSFHCMKSIKSRKYDAKH